LSGPYEDVVDLDDGNRPTTKVFHLVPAGSRVLDVGCATGYLALALRDRKGCRVTGIEIDPEAARRAASACDSIIWAGAGEPADGCAVACCGCAALSGLLCAAVHHLCPTGSALKGAPLL
jgi:SAM-dependent methyltransferase